MEISSTGTNRVTVVIIPVPAEAVLSQAGAGHLSFLIRSLVRPDVRLCSDMDLPIGSTVCIC